MPNTINGRTPEEIKKGLECCSPRYESKHWVSCSSECPFRNEGVYCRNVLHACNKKYIQQLERERDEARNDVDMLSEQVVALDGAYNAMKRERDAAVEAAQPKWISVEEPPKHTCDYLVYVWVAYPVGIAHMQMRTGVYNIVRKEWTIPHDQSEVVGEPEYWMPLPTPPKEDV